MHACTTCTNFTAPVIPISMTTGHHLHMGFTCVDCPLPGPYGKLDKNATCIYDMVTGTANVDGSQNIPYCGCPNYVRRLNVNSELTPL